MLYYSKLKALEILPIILAVILRSVLIKMVYIQHIHIAIENCILKFRVIFEKKSLIFSEKKLIFLIYSESKTNYSLSGPYLNEQNVRKKLIVQSARKNYLICRRA